MKRLSIHTFMHVPFEGLGCIENWITKNGHSVSYTQFYDNNISLPDIETIDWLIVMGGPMGVYDEAIYPWLAKEKSFIRKAIEDGKTVIGICLGSQLIAEVLGSKVYPNKLKEIGWFNIKQTQSTKNFKIFERFEDVFSVFHWHGDTFDLPEKSVRLFSSEICLNQAFLYQNNVLGLQFHFEVTAETMKDMVANGEQELIESETVQSANKILNETRFIETNNQKMFQILDYMEINN